MLSRNLGFLALLDSNCLNKVQKIIKRCFLIKLIKLLYCLHLNSFDNGREFLDPTNIFFLENLHLNFCSS